LSGRARHRQHARFYWPSLKQLMLALIDEGFTPMPFVEGNYTPRLHFWEELPKYWRTMTSWTYRRQRVLGDVCCFWGNVPAPMLVTGTPD
jgi:hypothetical protein